MDEDLVEESLVRLRERVCERLLTRADDASLASALMCVDALRRLTLEELYVLAAREAADPPI